MSDDENRSSYQFNPTVSLIDKICSDSKGKSRGRDSSPPHINLLSSEDESDFSCNSGSDSDETWELSGYPYKPNSRVRYIYSYSLGSEERDEDPDVHSQVRYGSTSVWDQPRGSVFYPLEERWKVYNNSKTNARRDLHHSNKPGGSGLCTSTLQETQGVSRFGDDFTDEQLIARVGSNLDELKQSLERADKRVAEREHQTPSSSQTTSTMDMVNRTGDRKDNPIVISDEVSQDLSNPKE